MFSIVYGLFALFGKVGWEIEKNIDNKQSRNRARKNNRNIYLDKEGCERLVDNNQKIITRRNLFGEVMRCDYPNIFFHCLLSDITVFCGNPAGYDMSSIAKSVSSIRSRSRSIRSRFTRS